MIDYTKIANRINKQQSDISASYDAAEAKGATIPTNKNLENLASVIDTITGGGGEGAKLTDLVVTLNGEYLPNPPYNGFNKVTVSVPTTPGDLPVPTITSFPRATELIGIGKELSESTLLGGMARYGNLRIDGVFTWIAPTTIVSGTSYHNVIFTPNADDAYDSVIISVQVPVVEVPNNEVLKIVRQIGISDPEWQKVGFNATLVANANKLSSTPSEFVPAQDDYFDNPLVPVYPKIKHCMVNDETGEIIAWHGDPDFKWDGSENTSVYTYFPTFWIRRRKNADFEEIEVSEVAITGGVKIDEFLFATFAMGWQTITLSDDSTKRVLRSYAGATPDSLYVDGGVSTARTQAKATAGDNASGGDWRAIVIGLLHVVKYGTNAIQATIGTGRSTSNSGNTAQGNAHLILDGRDGYIGSQTSTSVWSLGICDFYSHKGILMDGIYSTGVDNRVRFCSDPSKFVQAPAEDQDGYFDLGYEMSYSSSGYTTETGIDDTNENPAAQIIPLRVNGDTDATSSTGTTDRQYYNSSYRYSGYAGVYYSNTQERGVFAFRFNVNGLSLCSARVLRPITL